MACRYILKYRVKKSRMGGGNLRRDDDGPERGPDYLSKIRRPRGPVIGEPSAMAVFSASLVALATLLAAARAINLSHQYALNEFNVEDIPVDLLPRSGDAISKLESAKDEQIWHELSDRMLLDIKENNEEFPSSYSDAMKPETRITSDKAEEKRSRTRRNVAYKAPFRGRYRGQTQSQYLNIGDSSPPGKAEAESGPEGSRAVVSGNRGMGQAQSQSGFSSGCEDCDTQTQRVAFGIGDRLRAPGTYPSGTVDGAPSRGTQFGQKPGLYTQDGQDQRPGIYTTGEPAQRPGAQGPGLIIDSQDGSQRPGTRTQGGQPPSSGLYTQDGQIPGKYTPGGPLRVPGIGVQNQRPGTEVGQSQRPGYTEGRQGQIPGYTEGRQGQIPGYTHGGQGQMPEYTEGGQGQRPGYTEGGQDQRPGYTGGGQIPGYTGPGGLGRRPGYTEGGQGQIPGYTDGRQGQRPGYTEGRQGQVPGYTEGRQGQIPGYTEGRQGQIPGYTHGGQGQIPGYTEGEHGQRPGYTEGGQDQRPGYTGGGQIPGYTSPGGLGRRPGYTEGGQGQIPGYTDGRQGQRPGYTEGKQGQIPGYTDGRQGQVPGYSESRTGQIPGYTEGGQGQRPGYTEGGQGQRPGYTEGGEGQIPGYTEGRQGSIPGYTEGGQGQIPGFIEGGQGQRPGYTQGGLGQRPGYTEERQGQIPGYTEGRNGLRPGYIEGGQGQRPGYTGDAQIPGYTQGGLGQRPGYTQGGQGQIPGYTQGGQGQRPGYSEGGQIPGYTQGGLGKIPGFEGGQGRIPGITTQDGLIPRPGVIGQDGDGQIPGMYSQIGQDRRPGTYIQGGRGQVSGENIQSGLDQRPGVYSQGGLGQIPGVISQRGQGQRPGIYNQNGQGQIPRTSIQGGQDQEPGIHTQRPGIYTPYTHGEHGQRPETYPQGGQGLTPEIRIHASQGQIDGFPTSQGTATDYKPHTLDSHFTHPVDASKYPYGYGDVSPDTRYTQRGQYPSTQVSKHGYQPGTEIPSQLGIGTPSGQDIQSGRYLPTQHPSGPFPPPGLYSQDHYYQPGGPRIPSVDQKYQFEQGTHSPATGRQPIDIDNYQPHTGPYSPDQRIYTPGSDIRIDPSKIQTTVPLSDLTQQSGRPDQYTTPTQTYIPGTQPGSGVYGKQIDTHGTPPDGGGQFIGETDQRKYKPQSQWPEYGYPGRQESPYDRQSTSYDSQKGGQPEQAFTESDDTNSQAETNIQQMQNGTQASASSTGTHNGGSAQSQITGSYTGSGSFSAQAQTMDANRGAQSQISVGKQGATSNAQGKAGYGQSQAQLQLGTESGATVAEAQSGGWNHGTNTQVQASSAGGLADAQANGPGSTSSQAQIGFQPHQEGAIEDDKSDTPFYGGGTASAQSGNFAGQSQTQIQGKFKYGISYNGAAQAGSGRDLATKNITKIKPFDVFSAKTIRTDRQTSPQSNYELNENKASTQEKTFKEGMEESETKNLGHTHVVSNVASNASDDIISTTEKQRFTIGQVKNDMSETDDNNYGKDNQNIEEYEELEEEDYDGELYPEQNRTEISHQNSQENIKPQDVVFQQSGHGQKQHILLGSLENSGIHIIKDSSSKDILKEGMTFQPGEVIPGTQGYTIPIGFRGRVSSVSQGDETFAFADENGESQAQTITLTPGAGNVTYSKPLYKSQPLVKSWSTNRQNAKSLSVPDRRIHSFNQNGNNKRKNPDSYVTVTKSVAGELNADKSDLLEDKKYTHTYYTKSSTCGYFTFTCNLVYGSNGRTKICKPNLPTNPDGTPVQC